MKARQIIIYYGSQVKAIIALLFAIGMLSSCVTNKKITYLQQFEDSEIPTEAYTPADYHIQPNDNLFIRVTTPDPRFSEMFNTLPVASATVSSTEQSVNLLSYSVKLDGTVDIPYLGSVYVAGKTLAEAKDIFQKELVPYITDAAITVKLVNNYLSILGEVRLPGLYPIFKEQMNIFQALSMAGDLDDFSDRTEISIIRKTSEESVVKEFNLTDRNIIDSEFYYVMPNDVIYVKPMKGKFWSFSEFPYAIVITSITATITTTLLILSYIAPE